MFCLKPDDVKSCKLNAIHVKKSFKVQFLFWLLTSSVIIDFKLKSMNLKFHQVRIFMYFLELLRP